MVLRLPQLRYRTSGSEFDSAETPIPATPGPVTLGSLQGLLRGVTLEVKVFARNLNVGGYETVGSNSVLVRAQTPPLPVSGLELVQVNPLLPTHVLRDVRY
eukprot:3204510-Rhodomonas_salina.4